MAHRAKRDFAEDLWIGVKVGGLFTGAFSAFATLAYLAAGSAAFRARTHAGLFNVLVCYAVGGVVGGALIGSLRPIRFSALGSFFIGAVATIPLSACMVHTIAPRRWYPFGVIAVLVVSLLWGGLGVVMHDDSKAWTE